MTHHPWAKRALTAATTVVLSVSMALPAFAAGFATRTSGTASNFTGVSLMGPLPAFGFPATLIAVSASGATRLSANGGKTWTNGGNTDSLINAVTGIPATQLAWAVGANGLVQHTTNGGSTWITDPQETGVDLRAVSFPGTTIGYAVGDNGTILKTTNSGASWAAQTSNTSVTLRGVSFPNGGNADGWAVGDNGTILHTTNGGTSWQAQVSGTSVALYSVQALNGSEAYAVGENGRLVATTNGGTGWSLTAPFNSSATMRSIYVSDAWKATVVGANGFIASSANIANLNASPFVTQTSGTANSLADVWGSVADGNAVIAGDGGLLLRYDNIAPTAPTNLALSTGGTWTKNNKPTFTWTASTDNETDIVAYYTSADNGQNFDSTGSANTTLTYSVAQTDGQHDFAVKAQDGGLNQSAATPVFSYIVDTIAPAVGAVSPLAATTGVAVTYQTVISDANPIDSCSFSVNGTNQGAMTIGAGKATISYTFATANNYTVQASCTDRAGNVTNSVNGTVVVTGASVPPADTIPSAAASQISASPASVTADNVSTTNVTVTVKNAAGVALSGKTVTLASSRPAQDTIVAVSATTNASGQATFTTKSNTVGTSTLTATADAVVLANIAVVFSGAGQQDVVPSATASSVIVSSPSSKPDNSTTQTVTVTVKNNGGTALAGKVVSLSSSRPGFDTIVVVSGTTNGAGQATFSVKSSQAGSSSYSASADGVILGTAFVTYSNDLSLPAVGSLLKTACPSNAGINDACKAVYYYGADGKRHAFPNAKIYNTWYADFSGVVVANGSVMAILPLGKNVTYRPGSKLVKFQSLNTVYAVAKGSVLRAITSESVAASLYGSNWNTQVDDISDAYFNNYSIGAIINSSADYNAAVEANMATTINMNL